MTECYKCARLAELLAENTQLRHLVGKRTYHDDFYDCESTTNASEHTDAFREHEKVDGRTIVIDFADEQASEDSREKLEADVEHLCNTHGWTSKSKFFSACELIIAALDRQADITDREGREAWHKAASGEIYQANQRAAELQGAVNERNGRIARLEAEYAKLQEHIDRILRAPNLSKGVNMQLVEGVEALNERVSDLEAEVEQYELLCQRWEDLYHAVRDQRNAMRDRLAELEVER